mmetsp:Transcript_10290/g.29828  ORF Transcript_10290/g.29828 Transcript_10290/m.29828 type:complete len:274 (-) Transcript_10290:789-1610(-)
MRFRTAVVPALGVSRPELIGSLGLAFLRRFGNLRPECALRIQRRLRGRLGRRRSAAARGASATCRNAREAEHPGGRGRRSTATTAARHVPGDGRRGAIPAALGEALGVVGELRVVRRRHGGLEITQATETCFFTSILPLQEVEERPVGQTDVRPAPPHRQAALHRPLRRCGAVAGNLREALEDTFPQVRPRALHGLGHGVRLRHEGRNLVASARRRRPRRPGGDARAARAGAREAPRGLSDVGLEGALPQLLQFLPLHGADARALDIARSWAL